MDQNMNQQPPEFNGPQQYQQPYQYQPQYQQPYQPQVRPQMSFGEAIKTCFKKYFDFKGRARRSEYWWFVLFVFLVAVVWTFVGSIVSAFIIAFLSQGNTAAMAGTAALIICLVLLLPLLFVVIPQYAVLTRRLHDTGKSGWWVVLSLVLGLIYLALYAFIMVPLFDLMGSGYITQTEVMQVLIENNPGIVATLGIVSIASFALGIVLLVFTLLDSSREENKYGPSPKYQ